MNRRIALYSALGSIATAALVGIVYVAFFGGARAEEAPTAKTKSDSDASATRLPAQSGRPDPLFTAPVQMAAGDRGPVADPFQRRGAPVVQTGYGEEPRRLPPDPTANPLQLANDGLARSPATIRDSALDLQTEPVGNQRRDPFGLRTSGENEASSPRAIQKAARGANRKTSKSSSKKGTAAQDPLGSRYSDVASGSEAGQQTIEPAPFPADATDAYAATTTSDQAQSVFDRRSARQLPENNDEAANAEAHKFQQKAGGRLTAAGSQAKSAPPDEANELRSPNTRLTPPSPAHDASSDAAAREIDDAGAAPLDKVVGRDSQTEVNSPRAPRAPQGASNPFASAAATAGSGRPGSRQVEGKQTPQITIQKTAPEEIQVGKAAKVELHVRNSGTVVAQNVEIRDLVPEHTQFITANPPAEPNLQGELVWSIGALKPGDEILVEMELMPVAEGEVGSVAVVTFQAEAGARSRVTKPDLTLQVSSVKQVMIGQEVMLSIRIANPGTGAATGVVIEEHVPPGLKHPAGTELEFEVGALKPGESRDLDLTLTAAQAGRIINQIAARGEGSLQAQAQCELEVIAPALAIEMDGPARRYLERQATYTVSVSNPGTAPAKDVELLTRLPKGLKFVKADNAGHYDAQSHTVVWSLEELPPAETGRVTLTAIPVEPGEQRLRAEGRAKQNLADEKEQITIVEGLAALLFEVADVADPIEIKGETEYEVRVTNQGSKAADNVRLVAILPPELKFVSATGPTRFVAEGQRVIFEPLSRLSPKADTTYRIAVQGLQAGDLRMKVQLNADDLRQPITKEESTRVYSDE